MRVQAAPCRSSPLPPAASTARPAPQGCTQVARGRVTTAPPPPFKLLSHFWLDETNAKIKSIPIQKRTEPKGKKHNKRQDLSRFKSVLITQGQRFLLHVCHVGLTLSKQCLVSSTRELLTISYLSYFKAQNMIQRLGNYGKSMALTVSAPITLFSIFFSLLLEGGRKFTFPVAFCIVLNC